MVDAIPYIVIPAVASWIGGWIPSLAAFLIVGIVWTILPEARSGATPGKRMAGIRTVSVEGTEPIGMGRSVVRWFVKYVVLSVLPVGYLWYWRSPNRQTLADLAARSTVLVSPMTEPAAPGVPTSSSD